MPPAAAAAAAGPPRRSGRPLRHAGKRRRPGWLKQDGSPGQKSRTGRQRRAANAPQVGGGESRARGTVLRRRTPSCENPSASSIAKLDKTQEWAENNYYHLPIDQQNADLVTVNAFWRDYAAHDPAPGPARSARSILAEASRNFPEMMFALAVLDLPFEAEEHATKFDQAEMTLTAGSPLVVFHEEIKQAEPLKDARADPGQPELLPARRPLPVREQRAGWTSSSPRNSWSGVVYGCQVVVTNPTSSPQKLDVLLQVPAGAIPVLNGQSTRSVHIDLEPYRTQTLEYHFYFPAAGEFPHYPVHVAKNERLLAQAAPFTLNVVDKLSRVDTESWDYVSQHGTNEDVLRYLQQQNLHRVNLDGSPSGCRTRRSSIR